MIVRELIAELQKLNPDAAVMVPGFDGGFQIAELVHKERLRPTVDDSGYHCYAAAEDGGRPGLEYVIIEPEPVIPTS
jgi:hypothetical protein